MKELELKDAMTVAGGDITCTGNTHVTINSSTGGGEGATCDVGSGGGEGTGEDAINP